MRLSSVALLARSAAGADRARFALVSGSVTVAGALLLAGARIARLGIDSDGGDTCNGHCGERPGSDLAPYVSQAGLRPGVVLGALLLTVPVLALAVQALRVGTLARERRMSSLRLAGGTPGDVRRVAGLEAASAAATGAVAAGPAYVVLWVLLGLLPASGLKLLPAPDVVDLLLWAVAVLAGVLLGACSGAVLQGAVVADPLGVRGRRASPQPGWANLAAMGVGLALLGTAAVVFPQGHRGEFVEFAVLLAGLLLLAFSIGPRLVRRRGRRLARRGPAIDLLAGSRLAADPNAAGRVAAVLVVCGLALGVEAVMVTDLVAGRDHYSDLGFYLTGYALATVGVVIAIAVAVLTLLVGAADQLLDARRPLASLVAMGVDVIALQAVLRRQQSAAAVPAAALGAVLGGAMVTYLANPGQLAVAALPTLAAALLASAAVLLATRLSTTLLRSRLREATDPAHLRVA